MKVLEEKTEVLLMEYASGALDDACSMLVASYITLCPEARNFYRQCEALGGALIEHDCQPVAMQGASMQAVLNRLDDAEPAEPAPAAPCRFCKNQALPSPIAETINDGHPKARWRKTFSGTRFYNIFLDDACYHTMLVRMAPYAKALAHEHPGMELTLVLEGGFKDEYGDYKAGDLVIIDELSRHQPVAGAEGCLCLIATESPVRFTGSLGKLLNLMYR